MKQKKKRRNYVLIEIMLSIALVSICLLPLIQPLFLQLKKESESVYKFRLETIAKNSFLEVKKEIHNQNKNILISTDKNITGLLPSLKTGQGDFLVERSYTISILKSYQKSSSKAMYYLCNVDISLKIQNKTTDYPFTLFIEEIRGSL